MEFILILTSIDLAPGGTKQGTAVVIAMYSMITMLSADVETISSEAEVTSYGSSVGNMFASKVFRIRGFG